MSKSILILSVGKSNYCKTRILLTQSCNLVEEIKTCESVNSEWLYHYYLCGMKYNKAPLKSSTMQNTKVGSPVQRKQNLLVVHAESHGLMVCTSQFQINVNTGTVIFGFSFSLCYKSDQCLPLKNTMLFFSWSKKIQFTTCLETLLGVL